MENSVDARPRQQSGTSAFRGKNMRTKSLDDFSKKFLAVNNVIWENQFLSTSKSRAIALGYANTDKDVGVLMEYTSSRSGGDLGSKNQEITFPPNTLFKVISVAVRDNYEDDMICNAFVTQKECKNVGLGTTVKGKWKQFVHVTLEEAVGRSQSIVSQKEVEQVCQNGEQFLRQCGEEAILQPLRGNFPNLRRKFAGIKVSECTHGGTQYECKSRDMDTKCGTCVLCQRGRNIEVRVAKLPETSCLGKGKTPDGYFTSQ